MHPNVWFLMPAYNVADFIGEALESVAAQTYAGCRAAVVDDGSVDATFVVASKALADPRLAGSVILRQAHQRYTSAANEALRLALQGGADIIARLDADDTQDPSRIAKQVAQLEAGADLSTTEMWFFGAGFHGRVLNLTGPMDEGRYGMIRGSREPCCGSIVAWARVYRAVGGFDPRWEWSPDTDWNFRVIRAGGYAWAHVPEHLYGYRKHPGETTNRHPGAGARQYAELCLLHQETRLTGPALERERQARRKFLERATRREVEAEGRPA